MDNIRGVIGCPVAGLTPNELFDASVVVREFNRIFIGNKAFTNLPRKFNVTISACKEVCTHAESQDLALTPATKEIDGMQVDGFNIAVGGKLGSGGFRMASPLDVFVTPQEAAAVCSQVVMIFRDYGARELRTKARLAFLIESWGAEKFRSELERRLERPLAPAGKDQRTQKHTDHVGLFRQKQAGLNYVGLAIPVGRMTSEQTVQVAELAENYGTGQLRFTVGQNVIIPNVPDNRIGELTEEPVLQVLRYDPSEVMRGLVSCTGMDYCHFALIETKGWALKTARILESKLGKTQPLRMHWSGCPAGCGNHAVADVGLLGKNIKVNGEILEAVDVFAGGAAGCEPNFPIKVMEDVPCEDLPEAIAGLVKHGAFKTMRQQLRKIPQPPLPGTQPPPADRKRQSVSFSGDEIAEGVGKLVRLKGDEMAVFKSNGKLYGVQNICPHEGGQLCNGWIDGGEVVCPLHGYKFDLKTGACSTDPTLKSKSFSPGRSRASKLSWKDNIVAQKNHSVKTKNTKPAEFSQDLRRRCRPVARRPAQGLGRRRLCRGRAGNDQSSLRHHRLDRLFVHRDGARARPVQKIRHRVDDIQGGFLGGHSRPAHAGRKPGDAYAFRYALRIDHGTARLAARSR